MFILVEQALERGLYYIVIIPPSKMSFVVYQIFVNKLGFKKLIVLLKIFSIKNKTILCR